MIMVKGKWWNGGYIKNPFELNKFFIEKYQDIKTVFKKNQGFIITLNNKITIKKEAGAYNFFIKTNKRGFKKLKAKNIKKLIEKLNNEI